MAPFQRRTTFVVRLRRVQDEIYNLNMLFIYSQLASLSLMQLLRSRNMRLFFLLNIFVGTRWTKQEAEYFFSLAFDDQLRCRSGTGFLFGDPPSDHTLQFSQRQRCMTHAIWVVVSNTFYIHPYLGKWSNLTNIFQMGWNHQLVMFVIDLNLGHSHDSICELKWPRQDPSRQQDMPQASYSIMLFCQVFGMVSC